jgi:hypothetical protein
MHNGLQKLFKDIDSINESKGVTTDNFKTSRMLESDPFKKIVYYIKSEKDIRTLTEILESTQKRLEDLKKLQEMKR